MPLLETKGAGSAQGFGLITNGGGEQPLYVEDVFSTYLYTGTGSAQTITNGIDLEGEGGLIWTKNRTLEGSTNHILTDSAVGLDYFLRTNQTSSATSFSANSLTAPIFYTDGFKTSNYSDGGQQNGYGFVTWTFRKAPKFFDVKTFTTTYNSSPNVISHDLDGELGCAIFKQLNSTGQGENWIVYHRSLGTGKYLRLNLSNTVVTDAQSIVSVNNTTGTISFGYPMTDLADRLVVGNTETTNWVGYFFAHNSGGFGDSSTDDIISCGTFTTDGSGNSAVDLGWEPQFVMTKGVDVATQWVIQDSMRGMYENGISGSGVYLFANLPNQENPAAAPGARPAATGFKFSQGAYPDKQFIYIAIRRGPMKIPTDATKVFTPATFSTGSGTNQTITANAPADLALLISNPVNQFHYFANRLAGSSRTLRSTSTNSESTTLTDLPTPTNNDAFNKAQKSFLVEGSNQTYWNATASGTNSIGLFTRAPNFFDVVFYTGTSAVQTVSHNLTVAPELMIFKARNTLGSWPVYFDFSSTNMSRMYLEATNAAVNATYAAFSPGNISSQPSSTSFSLGTTAGEVNTLNTNYVAYLFATCPGVSKVGSYTGTGTTKQVDCGFTGGARFVLIKRTDDTGAWYVWDSARGIIAGDDPYILLNSTAAEVTNTDYVDTYSAGFEISSTAPAAINASGGTFIFLAIA